MAEVAEFMQFTGCTDAQARRMIEHHGGDVNAAVDAWFDGRRDPAPATPAPSVSTVSAAPTNAAAASDTPAQNEDLSLPASRETLSAIEDFEASFGRQHPRLLPLSLPHALQNARQRHMFLLVYVHSRLHDDTEAFVRDTFCKQDLKEFVDENFVCYLGSINKPEAFAFAQTLGVTAFPWLGILHQASSTASLEVLQWKEGAAEMPSSSSEVVAWLSDCLEREQTRVDAMRQQVVAARERSESLNLRQAQDDEYLASMRADMQRLEELEQERERQRLQQQEADALAARAAREQEQKQAEAAAKIARFDAEVAAAAAEFAAAAPPSPGPGTVNIAVKLPSGKRITRRFLSFDSVSRVYHWVLSSGATNGRGVDEFILCTAVPPVTQLSRKNSTLEEAGISGQVALVMEEIG